MDETDLIPHPHIYVDVLTTHQRGLELDTHYVWCNSWDVDFLGYENSTEIWFLLSTGHSKVLWPQ